MLRPLLEERTLEAHDALRHLVDGALALVDSTHKPLGRIESRLDIGTYLGIRRLVLKCLAEGPTDPELRLAVVIDPHNEVTIYLDDMNSRHDGGGVGTAEPSCWDGIEREEPRLLSNHVRNGNTETTGNGRIAAFLESREIFLDESREMLPTGKVCARLDQQTLMGVAGRRAEGVEMMDLVEHGHHFGVLGTEVESDDEAVFVEEAALVEILDDPFADRKEMWIQDLLVELL